MRRESPFTRVAKTINRKEKITRRLSFLMRMELLIPWDEIIHCISPFYPSGRRGRPPIELGKMIRMYFLQRWYEFADEALEDAIYDSAAMQQFIGINVERENIPDATTLLKFRRLLNESGMTEEINALAQSSVARAGLHLRLGTVVEAMAVPVHKSSRDAAHPITSLMNGRASDPLWDFAFHATRNQVV